MRCQSLVGVVVIELMRKKRLNGAKKHETPMLKKYRFRVFLLSSTGAPEAFSAVLLPCPSSHTTELGVVNTIPSWN